MRGKKLPIARTKCYKILYLLRLNRCGFSCMLFGSILAKAIGDRIVETYDVILIGSGHNALIAAAYLTRAGRSVLVLEKNDRPGGLVRTEELTLPGFKHDVYSSVHPLFLTGPVYADLGSA